MPRGFSFRSFWSSRQEDEWHSQVQMGRALRTRRNRRRTLEHGSKSCRWYRRKLVASDRVERKRRQRIKGWGKHR